MASDRAEFDPKEIARASFPTAFRGYDTEAVRRYLSRLAAAVGRAQQLGILGSVDTDPEASHVRVAELEHESTMLRERIAELEDMLASQPEPVVAEAPSLAERDLDESELIELLGHETARIVSAARSAAGDIVQRAEDEAAALREQADIEARSAMHEADLVLVAARNESDEIIGAADAETKKAQARIKADTKRSRDQAKAAADKTIAEASVRAESDLAAARQRAGQIVTDAERMREDILGDLVRRRRVTSEQIDRMAAARDRLAQALAVARNELDDVASDISLAVPNHAELDLTEPHEERNEVDTREVTQLVSQLTGVQSAEVANGETSSGDGGGAEGARAGTSDNVLSDNVVSDNGASGIGVSDSGASTVDLLLVDEPGAEVVAPTPNGNGSGLGGGVSVTSDDDVTVHHGSGRDVDGGSRPGRLSNGATGDGPQSLDLDRDLHLDGDIHLDGDLDRDAVVDVADRTSYEPAFGDDAPVDLDLDLDARPGGGDEVEVVSPTGLDAFVDVDHDPVIDPARDTQPHPPLDGDAEAMLAAVSIDGPDGAWADGEEVVHGEELLDQLGFVGDPVLGSESGELRRSATRGDLPRGSPYGGSLAPAFEARDITMSRSTPGFRRRLKRSVNDDQSDVLDRLRAGRGPIKAEELPPLQEQLDSFVAALRPVLLDVVKAGGELLDADRLPVAAVDNLAIQLGKHIVECLRLPTIDSIDRNVDDDREAILDPVRAIYREFRNTVLPDLIEDALHEAFALGLFDAIGPDEHVLWVTDPRLDTDPICEDNSAAPPLPKGAEFPSGHVRPLSMPGCRCLAVPAG